MSTAAAPVTPRASLTRRTRVLLGLGLAAVLLLGIVVAAALSTGAATATDLPNRYQPPSAGHLFGTDRYGRDLLARTLAGLRLSLVVGTVAATLSALIALALALVAVLGGRVGRAVVQWLIDLFLALPHLVLLILIAFALGGGTTAVIVAVGITHWPRLTRILISVGRQAVSSEYAAVAAALGHSRWRIARTHIAGHLLPQLLVGAILMFPHAILHEAALSFLGLGIDPSRPAIGILLQESMRSLSAGHWWLAALPGLALLVLVRVIDRVGENVRLLLDPRTAQT
ncbi:MAG: ABC transporter permease [Actinomycetia bacterium]|nr:ABC transporter permease [Actinomycetes bacterium]